MDVTSKIDFDALAAVPGVHVGSKKFSEMTTLHLGGRPAASLHCATTDAVCEVVKILDEAQVPLLIVGGGSNLVVADGDLPLVAVVLECERIDINGSVLRAEAGAVWDDVVITAVSEGLGGIECLSGIPGSAGATPVQNVGAYGVEISDVLTRVELYDRQTKQRSWVPASELELAYRYSNLKFTQRAVVLTIELALEEPCPLRFQQLQGLDNPSLQEVRDAVLQLRRGKGMVYQEDDHDTWSAGSFFTNPIVDAAQVEHVLAVSGDDSMPRFPVGERFKLSAAWLIERAGFHKGYPGAGHIRLSTKHTLALTNRGQGTTSELIALADQIRAGVLETFGVELEPEPVWVL